MMMSSPPRRGPIFVETRSNKSILLTSEPLWTGSSPGQGQRWTSVLETGSHSPAISGVPAHWHHFGIGIKPRQHVAATGQTAVFPLFLQGLTVSQPSTTPLLDTIPTTDRLRALAPEPLPPVADALRREMVDAVSVTGGHLGAGLGVVELTVALHYVFNTPDDRIIWDVGHQAYPHKILTGRRDRIRTLRQGGGLSGFPKRAETGGDRGR